MKTLQESDIIQIMREEWDKRVNRVMIESKDKTTDVNDAEVLSMGLKLLHKKSKLRYTVDSVSPRDVILITPEGEKMLVDKSQLEDEYELD